MKLSELAQKLSCRLEGSPDVEISGVAAHPLLRVPARVERAGAEHRLDPRRHRQLRIEDRATDLEMGIERFAGNEEPHDLTRTLEDGVDAAIAQKALDRDWLIPASGQRFRCFVAAPAAHLHRVIRNLPGHLGGPHLAHGGLDP